MASDQCIKIHFDPLTIPVNIRNDWSFIHERKLSILLALSLFLPPHPAKALPSRLHKLHNVQCRNKVDRLRAIHLFSYFVRFSFCLPSHSLSLFFSLSLPRTPNRRSSKLLWPLTERMENDDDDDDIGIPLTFANYTLKIDLPMVHIEKFLQDTGNLWERVAANKHGSWVG